MSAAGGTGNLTAGALSIPVTYDASALAAQATKMQQQAEAQGNKIGTAMSRAQQRSMALANRQRRVGGTLGDDESYAGVSVGKFAKAGDSAAMAFAKSAEQVEKAGKIYLAASAGVRGLIAVTEALAATTNSSADQYRRAQAALQGLAGSIPIIGSSLVSVIGLMDTLGRELDKQESKLRSLDKAWEDYTNQQKNAYDGLQKFNQELSRRQEGAQTGMLSSMFGGENFSDYGKLVNEQRDQLMKFERQQANELRAFDQANSQNLSGAMGTELQGQAQRSRKSLLETQAQELQNFRDQQRKQEAQFARDKAANEERVAKESAERIAAEKQRAMQNEADRAKQQQERIQDTTKAAVDARERELAIARGLGAEYERNRLRLEGLSELDQQRIEKLDKQIEAERTAAREKQEAERELASLESRRFQTVTTGVMEVDRRRTAFGAPTGGGKMEVEDKGVARRIGELVNKIDGLVLQ